MNKKHQYRNLVVIIIMMLGIYGGHRDAIASVPAHPRVEKLIAEKKIPVPYYLQYRSELLQRGVNAPWASPQLKDRLKNRQSIMERSLGPSRTPGGSWKALVLLVKFSDKAQSVAASSFDSLLFGTSTGSMRDYYKKVSYNNLDIVTVNLPSSVGWLSALQTYSYYVNGQNGFGSYPHNAQKLVEDAVAAADSSVDFSQYDNDGDGYVDALFVVHSGPGAEFTGSSSDIWSHAWEINSPQLKDGVYIYRYSMEPEYWQTPGDMTCGVYSHELGHAGFGLPDLYDVDYSSRGLGRWSLMAGGSWNGATGLGESPAFPDAWCRAQMGYVVPTNLATNFSNLSIPSICDTSIAFRVWKNGDAASPQYYIVENRQRIGYDTYLPGDGILIYHVDENIGSDNANEWYPGHTSSGHYKVALEQADGRWDLEKNVNSGDTGDPYPGSTNNKSFTDITTPNSKDYGFNATNIELTNISSSVRVMTLNVKVMPYTVISIAQAKSDSNGDLIPDNIGQSVTVEGIVTSPNFAASENSSSFFIQDTSGGTNIYQNNTVWGIQLGDKILATARVGQQNGLSRLVLDSSSHTIQKLSTSNPIPPPKILTLAQYYSDAERYEGTLVRVHTVRKMRTSQPWPVANSDALLLINDGTTTDGGSMWIDHDTDIDGSMEPGYPIDLVGIASQHTTSSVPNDSALLIVRYRSDFLPVFVQRTIPLRAGFNLVSWNIQPANDSLATILSPILSIVKVVLGFDGEGRTFDPALPKFSTLQNGDPFHGYWIKMLAPDTLRVLGAAVHPPSPIHLNAGYNLVGYLPEERDSLLHALTSVIPFVTVALGYDSVGRTYDPVVLAQFNTLNTMVPLAGYWLKMNQSADLVYPEYPDAVAPSVVFAKNQSRQSRNGKIIGSREWVSLYGTNIRLNGKLLKAGTIIQARDAQGTLCGECTTSTEGEFGFLSVYKDDPTTSEDEGVTEGELIRLFADNEMLPVNARWTTFGDIIHVSEKVTAASSQASPVNTFWLGQNYPNPFNPTTTIRYSLPIDGFATIRVFDVLGEEMQLLSHEKITAGEHTVEFDGSQFSSGMYFYRLEVQTADGTNRTSGVKKFILLK